MTSEQIEAHKMEQEKQMNEIKQRRMEDESHKKQWDNLNDEMYRKLTLKERELSRNIRHLNRNVREENQQLAEEQKEKIEQYEKVVNNNVPTDDYFNQFNTTAR
jgi:chromosome segregation ATPase